MLACNSKKSFDFNLLDPNNLIDPQFHAFGDPHVLWSHMRENIPVFFHSQSRMSSFWSITRHEDVKAVYSNPKIFSSAQGVLLRPSVVGDDPGGGLTLALTDPPQHKKLRSLMMKWFTPQYVRSLEGVTQDKINELLTRAREKQVANFTHDIAAPLTLFVTSYVLGLPSEMHDTVFKWSLEAFNQGKSLASLQEFMLYFSELMDKKRKAPQDDLASAIVNGRVDEVLLSDLEVLLNFENLIGATENAGLSISSGILAFLENPDSWALLQSDRSLVLTSIEEIFRWASSASHSMRVVTEDTILRGKKLSPGDRVVLWLPSANRDAQVFTSPFKFDIRRKPNPHLALGYGAHFCMGNALGRLQIKLLFNTLLDSSFKIELCGAPSRLQSIHVNGPEVLPIHLLE